MVYYLEELDDGVGKSSVRVFLRKVNQIGKGTDSVGGNERESWEDLGDSLQVAYLETRYD